MLVNDVWSIFSITSWLAETGLPLRGTKNRAQLWPGDEQSETNHCFLETQSHYTTVYLCDRYLAQNETKITTGVV